LDFVFEVVTSVSLDLPFLLSSPRRRRVFCSLGPSSLESWFRHATFFGSPLICWKGGFPFWRFLPPRVFRAAPSGNLCFGAVFLDLSRVRFRPFVRAVPLLFLWRFRLLDAGSFLTSALGVLLVLDVDPLGFAPLVRRSPQSCSSLAG